MTNNRAVFMKDLDNKKLTVVRPFDAPLGDVWQAWTTSEILDKWWAPKPYKAETKSMDFREGGRWLYCMVGPEGDKSWCTVDYKSITPEKSITCVDAFSDEEGNRNTSMPQMDWRMDFSQTGDSTTVTIELTFAEVADMEAILKMGFEEGFAAGLNNLDEYFSGK